MPIIKSTRLCALLATGVAFAQSNQAVKPADRASAYYHYSLGHYYAELAGQFGNRGDYVNRAIENYRLALREDPTAGFLAEELSDLYVQSGKMKAGLDQAEEDLRQNPNDINARRLLARIYTRLIGDTQQGKANEEYLRKAIEQYKRITDAAPSDTDSLLMLGRLYSMSQNSPEAEKAFQKVLETDPNSEDALSGLAMTYNGVGDSKRATEILQRLVNRNPSLRTLTALASSYEQMHDYKAAADTLRRAVELEPNNLELRKAYAQTLAAGDRLDEAAKIYTGIAAEDPKDAQTQLRLSQIYRQQRNFVKAREANEAARRIDPDNLEVRYNEVNLLEAEGQNARAITALKDMLDQNVKRTYTAPEKANRIVFLEKLGLLYRSTEQYPLAVQTFRQIGELDPDLASRAIAQVIDTYRIGRDYPKAAAEADAAIKRYPQDRVIRSVRASVLADMGKGDQAIAETRKLLGGKDDRDVYVTLAQLYEKTHNYAEEAKAIDSAEKLSTSKEDKESIRFLRGAMFEKQKMYDQAEAEFRKVLAESPDNANALNYLGYMLADRNVRLNEAQQMIAKAVELEPGNGAYLDSLGWVYYRLNRLPEAEKYLRSAVEKTPNDPTVRDHLGDTLFKAGKLKDAIDNWQTSLKNYENSPVGDQDPGEVAKIQRKLDTAKTRLARETGSGVAKH